MRKIEKMVEGNSDGKDNAKVHIKKVCFNDSWIKAFGRNYPAPYC